MALTPTYRIVNAAGVGQSSIDLVTGIATEAFRLWSASLAGDANLTVEIAFRDTAVGRASGGWGHGITLAQSGGFSFSVGAPAYELGTGLDLPSTDPDLRITIDPDYLRDELFLDPTPQSRNDIPTNKTDTLSIFLHEIGHALAFIGNFEEATGSFTFNTRTAYDRRLITINGETFFDGPNVRAVYGAPIPLTDNNYTHYGNSSDYPGNSSDPLLGLMNGVAFYQGYAYTIGALDLAVFADTGLGTVRDDILDLPDLVAMRGGAGNDQIFGSSVANTLFGDEGDDILYGKGGADVLTGGAGNDIFVGTAAELIGDTITDLSAGDRIRITDFTFAGFTLATRGNTLTFAGGNLTLQKSLAGYHLVASAAQTGGVDLSLAANPDSFRLYAADGFAGKIGGGGAIFGTNGVQDLTLADQAANVVFDASFNRGGDIVRLPGLASGYTIARSGSLAVLTDADSLYSIPVGVTGAQLVFADGARTLVFDTVSESMRIGGQSFGTAAAAITAPATAVAPPAGGDPGASARIYLASGGAVSVDGNFSLFGTEAAEYVTFGSGSVTLDPSFNRGGDILSLPHAAATYTARVSGSAIVLSSADGSILIPVGTKAMTLDFTDDDRALLYNGVNVVIDNQVITGSNMALIA